MQEIFRADYGINFSDLLKLVSDIYIVTEN